MRILHVIPFLWSGAGNVVTRLCESQTGANTVGMVTSGRSKGFTDWREYRSRLTNAGVGQFHLDFFDRDPAVFWKNVERLSILCENFQPDLVHCHSGVPACAAAAIGVPFIATLHSWGPGRPDWMNTMDLAGLRRAQRVLCGAMAYRRILVDGGVDASRVEYLPWGLDLKEIRKQETESRASAPRFQVGFLGRIEPRKGQLQLAAAFDKFHKRYPESNLELVGPAADPDYAKELRTFIETSHLNDSVKLRGRVSHPYERVRNWNLFTSLSSDEGQGIAILEAMALGVPVMGRRVAGVEDYLHDRKTGLAVNSTAPGEIAEQIEWAMHHQSELARFALRAKHMVDAEYNWDSTVKKMTEVYETVTRTH
ncbi:MAG TPA: glycosyltransferase family 4 protein [Terriglobia bacterium]|nr:glycosyltransferase family 4 protein [Terriglobia bacterium]